MRCVCLLLVLLPFSVVAQTSQPQNSDPWRPVRFLEGEWRGTSEGQAGTGTVTRKYEFVMNGRFLHERNVSTYPPQEKNPKGEVHEHWTLFSHDRARRMLVMRQFHVEGFVNQYAMSAAADFERGFVFESEGFENLAAGWKARERYEKVSADEFVEIFELAAPGKEFEVYSRTHFRRVKPTGSDHSPK